MRGTEKFKAMLARGGGKLGRRGSFAIVLAAGVLALGLVGLGSFNGASSDRTDFHGWSESTLERIHEGIQRSSPIPVANACGLGASSCFQCHDSPRAERWSPDPWHEQHAEVDHSCAGCHQGNPRLNRAQMAHRDMIVDPREAPSETCASCHSADEVDTLLETYKD